MMQEKVHVSLGERSYDVIIGPGLMARARELISPLLPRPRVVVVSDETVAGLHLETLRAGLAASGIAMEAMTLPAGEATKNWESLTRTCDWLLDQKVERRDIVVALGGGVIGDLVGFAAAVLRRWWP